jgi:hypothetical protein
MPLLKEGGWCLAGQTKEGRERKLFLRPTIATKFVKCFTSLLATKSGVVTGVEKALAALISGSIN